MSDKLDIRTENANKVIKNHMIWSMGAGFIPVPIADLIAVGAIQLDMIRQLSRVYDIDFKETQGKAIITALTGSSIARIGARAVKFIPGVGSILGGITLAVLSGASSYAIGEVFKKHFETGGTFLDFDPDRLKKYYNEKFEKGKALAKQMQEEQASKDETSSSAAVVDKIKELAQLKEEGVITQEEFDKMKSRLINS